MLITNIQNSLSLMLHIKSYEPKKICLIFEKKGETAIKSSDLNEYHTIRFSISEELYGKDFRLLRAEMQNFAFFFCQKKDHGCTSICFLILFLLFPGVIVSNQWSKKIGKGIIRRKNQKFWCSLKVNKKIRGQLTPVLAPFFPNDI